MFWLCIIVVLLYCIVWLHLPLLSTMSTGYFYSPHLPVCSCYYHFVLLICIALYWIVLLCLCIFPFSLQWVPVLLFSSPTCLLVYLYFSCRKDDLFVYWHCVFLLAFCHWHWHLLLVICLLPQLLRAVAPALTLITSFKLRQVWCLPPIVDWLHDDCDVASVALSLISISGF